MICTLIAQCCDTLLDKNPLVFIHSLLAYILSFLMQEREPHNYNLTSILKESRSCMIIMLRGT
jgi:hypothetical protein